MVTAISPAHSDRPLDTRCQGSTASKSNCQLDPITQIVFFVKNQPSDAMNSPVIIDHVDTGSSTTPAPDSVLDSVARYVNGAVSTKSAFGVYENGRPR